MNYAYPGQTDRCRIGSGRTVWVKEAGREWPTSRSLTWEDDQPQATHSPAEFIRAFAPGEEMVGEYARWARWVANCPRCAELGALCPACAHD